MIDFFINESSEGLKAVSLEANLLRERKIFMTEEVTAKSCQNLLMILMYLEQEDADKEIQLYINSPGGDVFSGLSVYDYIRMMKTPVHTFCTGIAASMSALLFLAGEKRDMLPHSRIMIHDPSYAGGKYDGKKPHEIQTEVDNLRKVSNVSNQIIAERSGMPLDQVSLFTKEDTYFDAETAVKYGLATGILHTNKNIFNN